MTRKYWKKTSAGVECALVDYIGTMELVKEKADDLYALLCFPSEDMRTQFVLYTTSDNHEFPKIDTKEDFFKEWSEQYPVIKGMGYTIQKPNERYLDHVTVTGIDQGVVTYSYLSLCLDVVIELCSMEEFKRWMLHSDANYPNQNESKSCRCGGADACIECNPGRFIR